MTEVLIGAYAVAGDTETLAAMASDGSDPRRQAQAIRGLAIAGDDDIGDTLIGIYRNTDVPEVREAVLEAFLIADEDEAVLELFRASTDASEKRELLQTLVIMDSDAVWDLVNSTLDNGQ
jgi:hypothetical protein